MKKFRICPRCDHIYLLKQFCCKCGFAVLNNAYYKANFEFQTNKYIVQVNEEDNISYIHSKEIKQERCPDCRSETCGFARVRRGDATIDLLRFTFQIPLKLSPKTTEDKIEKLALLL
jgi:hypothetical protein